MPPAAGSLRTSRSPLPEPRRGGMPIGQDNPASVLIVILGARDARISFGPSRIVITRVRPQLIVLPETAANVLNALKYNDF
jgi:hypothetical protein